ncbi:MAG: NAD(P)-dependent alcohol dehydrogenase [Anaerolineae bacterium]|nr:NAD(P)-dependent alcohol dehydrogenase [Anaerolineae bacterium]
MKAAICTRYGPPEVLQVRDIAKPSPKKNDMLIKIYATAITASDCIIRSFNVSPKLKLPMAIAIGFRRPRQPILGMVMAGEIEAVGTDVSTFQPGDRVFGCDFDRLKFGMYAEYVTFPESGMIAPMPANMSFEEAAAVSYGSLLALHFLRKGGIEQAKKVLIYGASGAIGTSAVQLARHYGADVTGVCSTSNLDMVRSLGAGTVIDYTREDITQRPERYDLVLNAVGKKKVQLQAESILTSNGKHVTVDDSKPKPKLADLLYLKNLAEIGALKAVIDRCYPLEQIVEAHRYVDKGHKKGNVVITVTNDERI